MASRLFRLTNLKPFQNMVLKNGAQLNIYNNTRFVRISTDNAVPKDFFKININRTIKYCNNAEKNSFGMSFYLKKINDDMINKKDIDARDLNEAIYLIKTDEEIDTIKTAIVHYLNTLFQKKEIPKIELAGSFVSVLAMLKKVNKIIEIYNDRSNQRLFRSYLAITHFYNCLMHEKRYDDLVDIYMKQLPRQIRKNKVTSEENQEADNSNKTELNQPLNLNTNQLEMFTRALLLQNTGDSLNKFKFLVRFIGDNNGEIDDLTWLRYFYLAIEKDNPKLALYIINSNKFKFNRILSLNLKTVVYIQLNQLNDAFRFMQIMFNGGVSFFPYTLNKLRQATYTIESKEDLEEIDNLFRKIVIENRVLDYDLSDVVFEKTFKNEKTEEDKLENLKPKENRRKKFNNNVNNTENETNARAESAI